MHVGVCYRPLTPRQSKDYDVVPGDWDALRVRIPHRATESLDIITILLQDAVILVAGFITEYAYEHWLISAQPFFRVAVGLSSALFFVLYAVTVTVHVTEYIWQRFGSRTVYGPRIFKYLAPVLLITTIAGAALFALVPDLRNGWFREEARHPFGTDTNVLRLELSLPAGVELFGGSTHTIAVSDDGQRVAFVGVKAGVRRL